MKQDSKHPEAGKPWYRFGIVWLVVGGPSLVVVAGIVTAVIAYRGADPVLTVKPQTASEVPAKSAR
jgi:hypothetical protein